MGDLAVGAYADDDGGSDAGAVYVLLTFPGRVVYNRVLDYIPEFISFLYGLVICINVFLIALSPCINFYSLNSNIFTDYHIF